MASSVTSSGLEDWVKRYCEWLSVQEKNPGRPERLTMAWHLSGYEVSDEYVRSLERMASFKAYQSEMVADRVHLAKEVFQGRAGQMAEDYFLMADLAKKNGDYDKWAKYGIPFLNRIWAESKDAPQVNTQVVVNLGTGFASKVQDVSYEVVVVEPEG